MFKPQPPSKPAVRSTVSRSDPEGQPTGWDGNGSPVEPQEPSVPDEAPTQTELTYAEFKRSFFATHDVKTLSNEQIAALARNCLAAWIERLAQRA